MTEPDTDVFLFDTSHLAHWAEEILEEKGIPADLVPAPPDAPDRCGLALQVPGARAAEVAQALEAEGVRFRRSGESSA